MGLFDNMLKSGESLFRNENALDFEFVPKLLPYREQQQFRIAAIIKPLFDDRNGKNLVIVGPPGVGKTAAMKWVLRDLEETTDAITAIFMNCWQRNTTYKILLEICHELGYMFTQNKKSDELMKLIEGLCATKSLVFVFDEIDKVEDVDFLYFLLESVPKKSIVMITNFREWMTEMDTRILSRLTPESVEFQQYNKDEVRGILKERMSYAFVPNVWDPDAFEKIVERTTEAKDIRSGLYLLREAALAAENNSSRQITIAHAECAIKGLVDFKIKNIEDLDEDTKRVLEIVKKSTGGPMGEIFKEYQSSGGIGTYKTFQRKIDKLAANNFISAERHFGGSKGNTTLLHYHTVER